MTWLFPKPFDNVSSLLYLGTFLLFLYDGYRHNYGRSLEWGPTVVVGMALFALLLADRWDFWFYEGSAPNHIAALLLAARIVLIEIVAQLDAFSFSAFLYLVVPFMGFLYLGMRLCLLLAGFVLTVYVGKLFWYQVDWYTNQVTVREFLIFSVGLLFVIAMAKVVGDEKRSRARSEQLLQELEKSNRQLVAYAKQVEELATTRERNRMARDIHDSLGHYLTVINVQLEKALAFREGRPKDADQAIADAKRLAREALQDVRRSVGALRATQDRRPFDLKNALEELVAHTSSGDLDIDLRVSGSEEGYSGQALLGLYRAAQEALTNVQKHAGAGAVTVEVTFGEKEASLLVRDDGKGFEPLMPGGQANGRDESYGLQGLLERLDLLGGRLRVESSPGRGTCLQIWVPKDGMAREPVEMAAIETGKSHEYEYG
ncbi:MAG: sensor histidine kinase [Chloroflexia bacterium]